MRGLKTVTRGPGWKVRAVPEMDMGWVHPWVGLGWVVNEK